jgi:dihydroorotate dehydrogenase
MKNIIVSPPFGNYLSFDWATPVKGTFTLEPRPGLIKQIVKTLRPIKGGWINKIGLRNPGIKSIAQFSEDNIYSILGFNEFEWHTLRNLIPANMTVEINLGCPNTDDYSISEFALEKYVKRFKRVIVKLPPTHHVFLLARLAYLAGVRYAHISNTMPVPEGGQSGRGLKEINLRNIKATKILFPDMHIIAGGGIHTIQDIIDYKKVGAEYFSIATVCFSPIKLLKFSRNIKQLEL